MMTMMLPLIFPYAEIDSTSLKSKPAGCRLGEDLRNGSRHHPLNGSRLN